MKRLADLLTEAKQRHNAAIWTLATGNNDPISADEWRDAWHSLADASNATLYALAELVEDDEEQS